MNKSYIYLVEWDYPDSLIFGYRSFIVVANSEYEAINSFPNGDNNDWDNDSNYHHYWIPKAFINELTVNHIGEYIHYVETPYVIMNNLVGGQI